MEKIIILGTLLALVGCSSSNNEVNTDQGTYPFRLAMETVNYCDQVEAFNEYEVLLYNNHGELTSRHQPNDNGVLEAELSDARSNLMIVKKENDSSNLEITVLENYLIGDLGTFQFFNDDRSGCTCDNYDVVISAAQTSKLEVNRSYGSKNIDIGSVAYTDLELCELPNGIKQTLIISQLHEMTNELNYLVLSDADIAGAGDELLIDFDTSSKVGRQVPYNSPYQVSNHITYQIDEKFSFYGFFRDVDAENYLSFIEEPNIEAVKFEVSAYEGENDNYTFWSVTHPLSSDVSEIEVNRPTVDPLQLEGLLTEHQEAYDVSGQEFRFVVGRNGYKLPNNRFDTWHFLMPDKRDYRLNLELPDDYLPPDLGSSNYFDFQYSGSWALKISDSIESFDDIHTSDWLKVSLPIVPSTYSVKPPASFSRVALLRYFNEPITE